MPVWREKLFVLMSSNATRATAFFKIPVRARARARHADRVVAMQDYARVLRQLVTDATPRLLALGEDRSMVAPGPRQVDAASDRRTPARLRDQQSPPLRAGPVGSDADVRRLRSGSLGERAGLCARAVGRARHGVEWHQPRPGARDGGRARGRSRSRRIKNTTCTRLAGLPSNASTPATLDDLMRDYVGHLHHHLRQILGAEWTTATPAVDKVDLQEKFARVTTHWTPHIVASLNGQHVKVVKFQGAFVWHQHETRRRAVPRAPRTLSDGAARQDVGPPARRLRRGPARRRTPACRRRGGRGVAVRTRWNAQHRQRPK